MCGTSTAYPTSLEGEDGASATSLTGGLFAGTLGGLLGIGGGVVLMPILRFVAGLSPARAAGTCILTVFCTTLGGSYRHFKLGHLDAKFTVPVIVSGAVTTTAFSILFLSVAGQGRWLDLGIGLVFSLVWLLISGLVFLYVSLKFVLSFFQVRI